jgi:hypothetical protein
MIGRREFIAGLGGAAVWPLAARAQQQDDRVRALQMRVLRLLVESTAGTIEGFIREIERQVGWTTQLPWSAGTLDQRRFDGLRLLRQVPPISEFAQLDSSGKEELRLSRLAMPVVGSGTDYSQDPKFTEAVAHRVYYGPVYFRRESDAYMTLSVAGTGRGSGVSVVEVSLLGVWNVVRLLEIGERGVCYVVDSQGRVIAHHFVGLALRNMDFSSLPQVEAARRKVEAARRGTSTGIRTPVMLGKDINGHDVLVAYTMIWGLYWLVFAEIPVEDADSLAR